VGAPVRAGENTRELEAGFVDAAAAWAARARVDRQTLLNLGVTPTMLDRAGVVRTPVAERLRQHWEPEPFSVVDLARRSGLSQGVVRRLVAQEESHGVLKQVGRQGRTILYGRQQ